MEVKDEKMIVNDVRFAFKSYYAMPMSYEYCVEVKVQYKNADYYVMACYNDYNSEVIAVSNKEILSAWIDDKFDEDDKDNVFFEANDFDMDGYEEEDIPGIIAEATKAIFDSEFCNAIRLARQCADTYQKYDVENGKEDNAPAPDTAAYNHIKSLGFINADIDAEAKEKLSSPSYLPKEWMVAEICFSN